MKEKGFISMETTSLVLSTTISDAPTISTTPTLGLAATVLMIVDGASTKHISNHPQLHLATTFTMLTSSTLSSFVSLPSIISCILYLGKDWNTIEHVLPIYMLLKGIISFCG